MGKNNIPSNKNSSDIKKPNGSNHLKPYILTSIIWLLLILVVIIVILLNVVVSDKSVNADHLLYSIVNFATILSIFLSVSSICFALYTSMQTSRQYDNMSQAVTEIKATNEFMKSNSSQLLRNIRDIAKDLAYLGGKFDNEFKNRQVNDKSLTNYNIPKNNATISGTVKHT